MEPDESAEVTMSETVTKVVQLRPAPEPNGSAVVRRKAMHVPKAPEIVAGSIRRKIVNGELKEGDLLPSEAHLMEDFGVSRPTIREAFRILEAERLITVARGARGGAYINAPDPELIKAYTLLVLQVAQTTVDEIFSTRRLIEPPIVRDLATHPTPEAVARLRECLAQEEASVDDPVRFAAAVAHFHRTLIHLSGNRPLIHLMDAIVVVIEAHQAMALSNTKDKLPLKLDVALRSHAKLIHFIERGQAVEAEEHWRTHMEVSHQNWIHGYETLTIQRLMVNRT